jgi:NAD-dependent deacetylase
MTLRNDEARIATQNVDGLHALALEKAAETTVGEPPPSTRPLELHGSLFRVRCIGCPVTAKHRGPIDATSAHSLPHCSECGALLRPDIVWFGEALDPKILEEAMTLAAAAEACLVVGTSSVVQPSASLPLLTRQSGGRVVEVNPEETPLTSAAHSSLRGTAAHILPRILP